MEPAFAEAGQCAGVEIWRIEDFKPVPYQKGDYGKFHTGDSYIVLSTQERKGVLSWDIFFWLGAETSQDEAGAAAILSVQLDDQLGGGPVQHREIQEHESQAFLALFRNGIRYAPGGVASGFVNVDRDAHETRLYHVKGKRNIRVKQVDVSVASMNRGDCFILDVGTDIFVYQGENSKRLERIKAINAANQIRDQDHGGRSRVQIIDEAATSGELAEFFSRLGGGSIDDVLDAESGGDDADFERTTEAEAKIFRVSDESGSLDVQEVGGRPFEQTMLNTSDVFILDTGAARIYVWIGRQCTAAEKSAGIQRAEHFIVANGYPNWTHVTRVVEGGEPAIFRQFFRSWRDTSPKARSWNESAGTTRLEQKSAGNAPEFMPDDGTTGTLDVFRIENLELQPVPENMHGTFFGGDSYIVKYSYGGNKCLLYVWQGRTSSLDEKAAAALHAIQIDGAMGGSAVQIVVAQDHEPKHFVHIFQGRMVVLIGGKASGFKNLQDYDSYVSGSTRMFRVRGTSEQNTRASQQVAEAASLQSDDVFIVECGDKLWQWNGKDSEQVERDLAEKFRNILSTHAAVEVLIEGEEPSEFWDVLGGKRDDYRNSFFEDVSVGEAADPTLIYCYQTPKGDIRFETIKDFSREDLNSDDVFILDVGDKIFVWLGSGANAQEKKSGIEVSHKFATKSSRQNTVIFVVKEFNEPDAFNKYFN